MRTSILTSVVSGFIALSLAACSAANNEPVDQSAAAETAGLSAPAAPSGSTAAAPEREFHHGPMDPAAIVKKFDKNGDGVLQVSELPERMQKFMGKADTNGDGIITRAEFTAARAKMFDRLDRNHDGYLTKDDKPRFSFRRKKNGDQLQQVMLMLDKDGDGRVSREEFVNSPGLLFDHADTNHDGQIDAAELAAFKATMATRKTR